MKTSTNLSEAKKMAKYFGKKYGQFLYSGSLAVETALIASGVNKGDQVVIPDKVCHRVLLAIIRVGAQALIINPKNGYTITTDDIKPVLLKYQPRAIILVHNLGLPVDIAAIRKVCPKNIKIIEDSSQAWKIKDEPLNTESDYVVTSFGKSKPLSYGIGGAIFSNDLRWSELLDNYDKEARLSEYPRLPYTLPETLPIKTKELVNIADKNVRQQQKVANLLIKWIDKNKYWQYFIQTKGMKPSWHKFPIWTDNKEKFVEMTKSLEKYKIKYELPFKISLGQTNLATGNKAVILNNRDSDTYHILIKTRDNLTINIKKWIKSQK